MASRTLRIQIASDLHLEFHKDLELKQFLEPTAPYLALLGDISALGHEGDGRKKYISFLKDCCQQWEHVFVLLGNHEYYSKSNFEEKSMLKFHEVEAWVDQLCSENSKLTLLNRSSAVVEGVRIIGATLWGNIPEKWITIQDPAKNVWYRMNDYHVIHIKKNWNKEEDEKCETGDVRALHPHDTNTIHLLDLKFIKAELQIAEENKQSALVLTHHAPSFSVAKPDFDQRDPIKYACAADLTRFISSSPVLHTWAYGHTHYSTSLKVGKANVVSNQLGYPTEPWAKERYRRDFVLEIPETMPVGQTGCQVS